MDGCEKPMRIQIVRLCPIVSALWVTLWPALWPGQLAAQVDQTRLLFRSNAAGSRIERIGPAQRDNFRYIIEYEQSGSIEVERLFSDGIEKRRLERRGDADGSRSEEEYREGLLSTVTRYDPQGRIQSEERYASDGGLKERRNYSYLQDQGIEIEAFDEQGDSIYRESHTYTGRGQLSGIERVYSDGSERLASYSFVGDRLFEELQVVVGDGSLRRYDRSGRLIYSEELKDNQVIRSEAFEYGDGPRAAYTIHFDRDPSPTVLLSAVTTTRDGFYPPKPISTRRLLKSRALAMM